MNLHSLVTPVLPLQDDTIFLINDVIQRQMTLYVMTHFAFYCTDIALEWFSKFPNSRNKMHTLLFVASIPERNTT